jgi:hypothetical protein
MALLTAQIFLVELEKVATVDISSLVVDRDSSQMDRLFDDFGGI